MMDGARATDQTKQNEDTRIDFAMPGVEAPSPNQQKCQALSGQKYCYFPGGPKDFAACHCSELAVTWRNMECAYQEPPFSVSTYGQLQNFAAIILFRAT